MINIREELLKLKNRSGVLEPQIVVETARSANHPLHDSFEWDDTVAGHKFRVEQARALIRVHVTIEELIDQPKVQWQPKGTYALPSDGAGSREAKKVLENKKYRAEALDRVFKDVLRWRYRNQAFTELNAIFRVIDVYAEEHGYTEKEVA